MDQTIGQSVPGARVQVQASSSNCSLVVEPKDRALGLADWSKPNRDQISNWLQASGAVLFRGFIVDGQSAFANFAKSLSPSLSEYVYRSTPRTHLGQMIYTATEYPPKATIPLHNENSYQRDWPLSLMFYCQQPALEGGDTPLARTNLVTSQIPGYIRDKFCSLGVMYIRNYRSEGTPGLDLPWQTVFQTTDGKIVEKYCSDHEIESEWLGNGRLRTRQVCQAMAEHPSSKKLLWFNQAHLFHVSSLDPQTQEALKKTFKKGEDFPRASFGRTPFSGPRKLLVAMAGSFAELGAMVAPALGTSGEKVNSY